MKLRLRTQFQTLAVALLAAGASSLPAVAQTPSQLGIQLYAGLTITGAVGTVYSVEYVTDLARTNNPSAWRCLEFLQLLESPQMWVDKSAPAKEKRFYRAAQMDAPTNMVWIPPGTFRMGSPTNEVDRYEWEGPQTEVTISRGFWMGKFEVTQGDYEAVTGENPSNNGGDPGRPADPNRPVESVSWLDAVAYCVKLSQREREAKRIPAGSVYRLPTEAEWEYACRAGTSTRFSFGDDPEYGRLSLYAWYEDNGGGMTKHTVGQKLPNPWGLFDMHGNVIEWCQDFWHFPPSLPGGIAVDPLRSASNTDQRVVRGGNSVGMGFPARNCRSAMRWYMPGAAQSVQSSHGGFRVVLAPVVFRPQPNMVHIPPGTFLMGSPDDEQDRQENEGPQTQVTLTREFWMGKYEVTQGEYEARTGSNPSWFNGNRGAQGGADYGFDSSRPVEQVSWEDALAYCNTLTTEERASGRIPSDYAYRLPTEAEWEYACRAGTTTRFSYGDDPDYSLLGDYAWHRQNSDDRTHPVGQKLPNHWGLYDMHGNVFEWPLVPNRSEPGRWWPFGIVRSNSYFGPVYDCTSARRIHYDLANDKMPKEFGFRIVLSRDQP